MLFLGEWSIDAFYHDGRTVRDSLKIVKFVGRKRIQSEFPVTDKSSCIFQSLESRGSALMVAGLKKSQS